MFWLQVSHNRGMYVSFQFNVKVIESFGFLMISDLYKVQLNTKYKPVPMLLTM